MAFLHSARNFLGSVAAPFSANPLLPAETCPRTPHSRYSVQGKRKRDSQEAELVLAAIASDTTVAIQSSQASPATRQQSFSGIEDRGDRQVRPSVLVCFPGRVSFCQWLLFNSSVG